jgi:hypothetical protein
MNRRLVGDDPVAEDCGLAGPGLNEARYGAGKPGIYLATMDGDHPADTLVGGEITLTGGEPAEIGWGEFAIHFRDPDARTDAADATIIREIR